MADRFWRGPLLAAGLLVALVGCGRATAASTPAAEDRALATAECRGVPVDLRSDPLHCGTCSTTCASHEVCSAGTCGGGCLGGLTECRAACVDVTSDAEHCGDCGHSCGDGQTCERGRCAGSPLDTDSDGDGRSGAEEAATRSSRRRRATRTGDGRPDYLDSAI